MIAGNIKLTFAGAGTKVFPWDGHGSLHVSVSGASGGTITKLQYRHGSADTWKDYELDATVTNNGQFIADSMQVDDNFQLGITTDGAATVMIGKVTRY